MSYRWTDRGMSYRWTEDDIKQVRGKAPQGPAHQDSRGTRSVLRASLSPQKPPYKSKLELSFAVTLEAMKRQGQIDGWLYEPFVFKLAEGKRYRVDFISWVVRHHPTLSGGDSDHLVVTAYECKGWHKNYRDSLTHLKWAAQRFPFMQWKKVVRDGKTGFNIMDVVV